ncbi:MAG: DUF2017 domain-containing protein [Actinomycetes bacterium]
MFKRSRSGHVYLKLDDVECGLLEQLLGQIIELIEVPDVPASTDPLARLVGLEGPTDISEDPALARLFPDGYTDDAEAASDFRRFTEPDLRTKKLMCARISQATLDDWTGRRDLSDDQARSWLLALNDLRLTLGARIGLGDDSDDDIDFDDPAYHLYDWLTYQQGTLIEALAP